MNKPKFKVGEIIVWQRRNGTPSRLYILAIIDYNKQIYQYKYEILNPEINYNYCWCSVETIDEYGLLLNELGQILYA
jgi:hypothetical protein